MKTTVSNRGLENNPLNPVILPYWKVWGCVSETQDFYIPISDKQYSTKAEAIIEAKKLGEYIPPEKIDGIRRD